MYNKKTPQINGPHPDQDLSYQNLNQTQTTLEKGITLKTLKTYLKSLKPRNLHQEFDQLWDLTYTQQHKKNQIQIMEGNIYSDVFPYKHSKIAQNFHLNANYINSIFNEKLFVAAQAPTENSLQNFVLTLFFQPVSVVIMLCDYYHTEKYFTFKKGILKINSQLSVECLNIENKTGITKRILQINYQGINKLITHYNFLSWPDNSVPQPENYPQIEELIEIIQTVNEKNNLENQQQQNKDLIFVHCMAGIGRTGTLITLANIFLLLDFYKQNHKEDWESQVISIFSIIRREREQRQWIVQTEEQYEFVHKFTLRMFQKLFE